MQLKAILLGHLCTLIRPKLADILWTLSSTAAWALIQMLYSRNTQMEDETGNNKTRRKKECGKASQIFASFYSFYSVLSISPTMPSKSILFLCHHAGTHTLSQATYNLTSNIYFDFFYSSMSLKLNIKHWINKLISISQPRHFGLFTFLMLNKTVHKHKSTHVNTRH